MIHEESLLAALPGCILRVDDSSSANSLFRSPGLLPKHYSPKAKLVIWSWYDEVELNSKIKKQKVKIGQTHVIAHTQIPLSPVYGRVCVIPHDAEAFGRAIYAELHRCDEAGARLIVVEALPETAEWRAITDRLRRASA